MENIIEQIFHYEKKRYNMSGDMIDEDLDEKIEGYENDLDLIEDEIRNCTMKIQQLDIERQSEAEGLKKLQNKRSRIEIKLKKYQDLANISGVSN
jgi:hypothetical protein